MIGIYEKDINTIPSLIVVDEDNKGKPLPVITYFHGFTSAKEHNLPLAFLLAKRGYRVILPDSLYHGAREGKISPAKRQTFFWEIVLQNVKELEDIKDYVDESNLLLDERFGVAGTSMGGITTSAALTQYDWIKTAAVLMGTPKLTDYAKALVDHFQQKNGKLPRTEKEINRLYEHLTHYDLSKQPEKLKERPFLLWHGKADEVIPFEHTYTFYKQNESLYSNPLNFKFLSEANRGHKVGRYATLETVKWFTKQL